MLIPLGIISASGVSAGSFDLLETQVLGSSQGSVVFSSLSQYSGTYKHFQIRGTTRTNRTAADSDPIVLQFNGITTSSYSRHRIIGYNIGGTTGLVSNAAASQNSIMLSEAMPVSGSTANAFGAFVTDILDPFDTNKNTTVRTLAGMTASWSSIELSSGGFFSTAAISSIVISPLVGTQLAAGSRFSLYGIKGA